MPLATGRSCKIHLGSGGAFLMQRVDLPSGICSKNRAHKLVKSGAQFDFKGWSKKLGFLEVAPSIVRIDGFFHPF